MSTAACPKCRAYVAPIGPRGWYLCTACRWTWLGRPAGALRFGGAK